MTWETRDLPVLRAIVEASDEAVWHIDLDEIMRRTGFDGDTVQRALLALAAEHPPFFMHTDGSTMAGPFIVDVSSPTGHARRTVGTWPPPPEAWADRLIEAINEAADSEPDPEQRSKLRRLAGAVAEVGRGVFSEVIATVITKSAGMG